jgi:hypothetical protein
LSPRRRCLGRINAALSNFEAVFCKISLLNRDHSTVHDQLGAGDKAAVIRGQENHRFGDFIGLTHPAERDLDRQLGSVLFYLPFVAQSPVSLRWDHAGTDDGYPDLSRLQVSGSAFCTVKSSPLTLIA